MDGDGFSTRGGIWIFDRQLKMPWSGSPSYGSLYADRGYLYASWPFAKLHATGEQLSISSVVGGFVVTRANVLSITPFDWIPALGRGLRFEADGHVDAMVFWTYRRSKIMRDLAFLGWAPNLGDAGRAADAAVKGVVGGVVVPGGSSAGREGCSSATKGIRADPPARAAHNTVLPDWAKRVDE
ncbi:hypothetical protein KRM28CT15_52470 [Krasilnikovia sp. M28-CT-15]